MGGSLLGAGGMSENKVVSLDTWRDFNDATPQADPFDIEPDPEQIAVFLDVVFGYCEGWVPLRGFVDKGQGIDGRPHNAWIEIDDSLLEKAVSSATGPVSGCLIPPHTALNPLSGVDFPTSLVPHAACRCLAKPRASGGRRCGRGRIGGKAHGKRRDLSLGPARNLSLREAREAALKARVEVGKGIDPIAQRKAATDSGISFTEAARAVHAEQKAGWRNGNHCDQWLATLENRVFPLIGDKPVASLTRADMVDVLSPIWLSHQETAHRVLQRMRSVINWSVGKAVRTLEGRAPVAGAARYTNDITFPGQLYAAIVRSPHAAAKIRSVDLSGALKVSGVVHAMDGKAAAGHLNPITHYIDPATFGGKSATARCLALDDVWHYGQPVAVVVAEDKRTARYAASRIQVSYDPLPAVVDIDTALAPDSRRVVPGWDDNIIMQVPFRNGDPDAVFARAAHVTRTTVSIHRFSTQPIETRCYNAVWDAETQGITFYGTAQNPHPLRHVLSTVLSMPENKIRVVAPTIGGAFGMKMHGHPEEALMCLLARLLKRPVKWTEGRDECLLIGAREQRHHLELAFSDDGELLALRDRFFANTGAPSACPGWGMAFLTGLTMPGPYKVRDIDVTMTALVTNKPPWNAARDYGKEATAIALELAMDDAARQLGMDPVELRQKNFVPKDAFPYPSPTGLMYDSGDYAGAVEKALEAIDYPAWKARQAEGPRDGKRIGIGIAYELTPEGGALPSTMVQGWDSTSVRVGPDGSVRVLTGVTTPGTGNPTGIAQIVADELGVPLETIEVTQGDTTTCPYGFGNYSGRSTIVGGGSAALAAREVRAKVAKVAAALMQASEDDVEIRRGSISLKSNPLTRMSFAEVAYACYTRAYDAAHCIMPPLEATATFRPASIRHSPDEHGRINPYPSYSNAAYAAVCEVDVETGKTTLLRFAAAHDCGHVINPLLVEGQACGAIAFGVGGSMMEGIRFDPAGTQLTRTFMDYVMPRAADMPAIAMVHHDSPHPDTYMGLKGAGEAGVGGSAAAVVNAVNNALAPLGVAIQQAGAGNLVPCRRTGCRTWRQGAAEAARGRVRGQSSHRVAPARTAARRAAGDHRKGDAMIGRRFADCRGGRFTCARPVNG